MEADDNSIDLRVNPGEGGCEGSFDSNFSLVQMESGAGYKDIKSSFNHDKDSKGRLSSVHSKHSKAEPAKNMILLVDDELFNLNAIKLVLKYKLDIDVDQICVQAMSGE